MIYAYIRVSTDKQTVENQRFEINRFAKQRDFQIDVWVEETVSGTRSAKDRKLRRTIEKNKERGYIRLLSEISRLGRRLNGSNEYTECMYVEKCHPAHGEREI